MTILAPVNYDSKAITKNMLKDNKIELFFMVKGEFLIHIVTQRCTSTIIR